MSRKFKKPSHCKAVGDHQKYLTRITKTLYYGKLPITDCLSLPVTELAVEIFSEAQKGKSLDRLHFDDAARISRSACVSPTSLVLAMLYFERLKQCNPEYLEKTAPSDLFLVSLMVSSKFLFDDADPDEVFIDEWAASGGLTVKELAQLERKFLKAIDWEIYAHELYFWKKLDQIETELAKREGNARGHFTYTELQTLSSFVEIHNVIHCIAAVSVILAATYTAGLLTLLGSVFLASNVPGTSLYAKKIDAEFLPETETNFNQLDAVDVLKTGIILSTIQVNDVGNTTESSAMVNSTQNVSWDWWNVPVMNWLAGTSELVACFEMESRCFTNFLENKISGLKDMYLEAHIDEATKKRIQDQMESSWHEEWTDTIKYSVIRSEIAPLES